MRRFKRGNKNFYGRIMIVKIWSAESRQNPTIGKSAKISDNWVLKGLDLVSRKIRDDIKNLKHKLFFEKDLNS